MMHGSGNNGTLKGMAGLLALLLFVFFAVPAVPASARPAPAAGHAGEHHAVADCGSHDAHADSAPLGQEPRRGHHDQAPAAPACCAALHCPMLLAGLQPAPAEALPPAGLRVRAGAAVRLPAGLDVAPALPPPRDAA